MESFHRAMLSRAIELSKKAVENPAMYEPFGAVIVRISDLTVIGEGCNNMREEVDPTLHGEVSTIEILYVTDVLVTTVGSTNNSTLVFDNLITVGSNLVCN